jgi:hypothetical protein
MESDSVFSVPLCFKFCAMYSGSDFAHIPYAPGYFQEVTSDTFLKQNLVRARPIDYSGFPTVCR